MRTNHKSSPSNRTAPTAGSEEDGIEVKLHAPNARAVFVAGNFNGWDPRRTSLHKDSGGVWRTFLPLSPGRYEYRFIVDGQWQEDPGARESVPNPHGGRNSVLIVRSTPRPSMAEARVW
jgi:1,4-alpha-glucan branching enzyme